MSPPITTLTHERRRIVHFAVTSHPTAEWTAQQMGEAFPWDTVPRYLQRDRGRIFGREFVDQVKAMAIKQVLSAPRLPWQRACGTRDRYSSPRVSSKQATRHSNSAIADNAVEFAGAARPIAHPGSDSNSDNDNYYPRAVA